MRTKGTNVYKTGRMADFAFNLYKFELTNEVI